MFRAMVRDSIRNRFWFMIRTGDMVTVIVSVRVRVRARAS